MNILTVDAVTKIYSDRKVLDGASFYLHAGEKIGVVGINGTGKTTFLKLIAGAEEPDAGQIIRQNGLKTAYLEQNPQFEEHESVLSYCLNGSDAKEWLIQSNLMKLGVEDFSAPMEELSGGQRRRVALAKLLSADCDVLLLDEPTNHLDEEMTLWLEEYLKGYRGSVIMVTHDRYFLDRVSDRILEISHGQIYSYDANFSGFLELKAEREEMELASERKRQSILRIEMEWAKRGCRARTTKQKARLERLEALKSGTAPIKDQVVQMDSVETRMGKKTISLHQISKSYGEQCFIRDFSYTVPRNQRLGIIGPNGCGKSTLLRIIAGLLKPDQGEVEVGETISIGYLAQEEPDMNTDRRVIDYIKDIAEFVQTKEGRISASSLLERFLFTPDMQYTPVSKLSGGEKRRLYLISVLIRNANVLILDEPSNNMDIPTLTILEDYLNSFVGIVIAVSHDRYFLDNVVDRIFAFEEGHLQQYEGGYTDYLKAKQRRKADAEMQRPQKGQLADHPDKGSDKNSTAGWKQNRPAKLKFTYQEQREYETIDDCIAKLEAEVAELDAQMQENATNSAKLSMLLQKKEETEKLLEEKMDRWVYLTELADRIEEQKK